MCIYILGIYRSGGVGEGPYGLSYIGPPTAHDPWPPPSPVARLFVRVCTSLVRTCDGLVRGPCYANGPRSSTRTRSSTNYSVVNIQLRRQRVSTVAAGPSGPGGFLFGFSFACVALRPHPLLCPHLPPPYLLYRKGARSGPPPGGGHMESRINFN